MMLSIYTVKWSAYVVCIEYKSFRRLESKYIYIPELALFLTLNFEFQLFRNFFEHQTFFLDALGIRIFDMTLITSSTV